MCSESRACSASWTSRAVVAGGLRASQRGDVDREQPAHPPDEEDPGGNHPHLDRHDQIEHDGDDEGEHEHEGVRAGRPDDRIAWRRTRPCAPPPPSGSRRGPPAESGLRAETGTARRPTAPEREPSRQPGCGRPTGRSPPSGRARRWPASRRRRRWRCWPRPWPKSSRSGSCRSPTVIPSATTADSRLSSPASIAIAKIARRDRWSTRTRQPLEVGHADSPRGIPATRRHPRTREAARHPSPTSNATIEAGTVLHPGEPLPHDHGRHRHARVARTAPPSRARRIRDRPDRDRNDRLALPLLDAEQPGELLEEDDHRDPRREAGDDRPRNEGDVAPDTERETREEHTCPAPTDHDQCAHPCDSPRSEEARPSWLRSGPTPGSSSRPARRRRIRPRSPW
jgi:hypothetical protein